MKKIILILAIIIVGCVETNTPFDIAEFVSLKTGSQAPEFSLTAISGREISLNNELDSKKSVIIMTMSPDCASCKESLTSHANVYPEYVDQVTFVGFDVGLEDIKSLKEYVEKNNFVGEYVSVNERIIEEYGIVSTSIMYIIGSNGLVREIKVAPKTEEEWLNALDSSIT